MRTARWPARSCRAGPAAAQQEQGGVVGAGAAQAGVVQEALGEVVEGAVAVAGEVAGEGRDGVGDVAVGILHRAVGVEREE
ncbi:hypothetical protein GCM10010496_30380 [Streptomyces asoensis]|nr:hypothetical protein GCM10010496_30380 [Streptomyces asoensis]